MEELTLKFPSNVLDGGNHALQFADGFLLGPGLEPTIRIYPNLIWVEDLKGSFYSRFGGLFLLHGVGVNIHYSEGKVFREGFFFEELG